MTYPEFPKKRITLREATYFHGHLGPYLVLGLKAGDFALKYLKAKRYFGLEINVFGLDKKPKSCIIDGLQLSTGATFGKGNIRKFRANFEKIEFLNRATSKKLALEFKSSLANALKNLEGHKSSEILAKKIFKTRSRELFRIQK